MDAATHKSGTVVGARDLASWVILTATVLMPPLGLVLAATSGRWRAKTLLYTAFTAIFAWGVPVFSVLAAPVPATYTHVAFISCSALGSCVRLRYVHPFLHGLGVAGGVLALVVALLATPVVTAIYLAQTERRPEARPWLLAGTWAVILVGIVVAGQWG